TSSGNPRMRSIPTPRCNARARSGPKSVASENNVIDPVGLIVGIPRKAVEKAGVRRNSPSLDGDFAHQGNFEDLKSSAWGNGAACGHQRTRFRYPRSSESAQHSMSGGGGGAPAW